MAENNEIISALLDELASEVMALEPGDLMTYGEVLSRLERLSIVCEGVGDDVMTSLADALKALLEGMILGEVPDQDQGLENITEGVSLGQSFLRGDAKAEAVRKFLADRGLAEASDAPAPAAAEPPPDLGMDLDEEPDEAVSVEEALPLDEPEPPASAEPAAQPAPAAEKPAQGIMINEEDAELLESFVTEAMEHLESIEVNVLLLEDTPDDNEALNAVFRPFHTVKGVSGFLNLMDINHLAHALENLLDLARSGKLVIDGEGIDIILAGVDLLRQMITDAQDACNNKRPIQIFDTQALEARLESFIEQATSGGGAPAEEEDETPTPRLGEVLVDEGVVQPEALEAALEEQRKRPDRHLGEILVSQGSAAPSQVAEGIKQQRAITQAGKATHLQEVKIDTNKLDNLLDMVGELVIAQSMVQANPNVVAISDRKLSADLNQLGRITTELQKTTMAMRMVPIKQTFQRMVRVVRDTAKKQGKQIRLVLEGEGTEIDRNMVEKFYDPLVHMVRNSVDHGIENPDERDQTDKPEEGTVVLAAYHKGGSVCIEIRDDGRGLSREKIVAKAVERGLIDNDDEMSDEEVFHLIMQPGFSTAEKITDISGRGVGMDVVQKAIDSLRGKVEISSKLGQGTTVTIALPLTLAIIDGMVVQVGEERFILPTIAVAESLRPHKKDYTTVQGRGEMIMIRGHLLPLVRLHGIVSADPEKTDPWEALVVVLEHHGQQRCLMVDKLIGRQEVVIKSLGDGLKDVKVVAGGAIMGDGRVGLILDVEGIFRSHDGRRS